MDVELVITEILLDEYFSEKETYCLKCRCADNSLVAFWGEPGKPNRNIVALRHQRLPLHITLTDPGECLPTDWEKKKYKLSWSVPSHADVYIFNEH